MNETWGHFFAISRFMNNLMLQKSIDGTFFPLDVKTNQEEETEYASIVYDSSLSL